MLTPKSVRARSMSGQAEVVSVLGLHGQGTIPAPPWGTGTLRALWLMHRLQPQEAAPAACWLWETAVVSAAGGTEAGGLKGLRDRSLRGLPGFSSVGFAAALCHLGESTSSCGLHKQCLTPLPPSSPWGKPVPAMAPQQHREEPRAVQS